MITYLTECNGFDLMITLVNGEILFKLSLKDIYIIDLFYFTENVDMTNYADDTTPCACKPTTNEVITTLQSSSDSLFRWICQNLLKANYGKSHIILSEKETKIIDIQSEQIQSSPFHKLLGVTFDSDLKFDIHIKMLSQKANLKLHALARISTSMNPNNLKSIMRAFVLCQFNYCPLVWMFHSRECNNRLNHIHERALRIAYKDKISSFQELLAKDGSVTIHHKNLQLLATEVFTYLHGISPKLMSQIF